MPIPKTAIEYFKTEKNKNTEPYQKFYDEALAALTCINAQKMQVTPNSEMTSEKAIKMIDEYLVEPNNINKEWVEVLEMCKEALIKVEKG